MSLTILVFIVVAVVEVVAAQKKAKQKEFRRKMQQRPTDMFDDDEPEERESAHADHLRDLLEKYASAHPDDPAVRRHAPTASPAERLAERPKPRAVTPEELSDKAFEARVARDRVQALMDYRRERLIKLKKAIGISRESFEKLKKKCLNENVSDDEFERILQTTENEIRNKRVVTQKRRIVPEDCEMQKTLQAPLQRVQPAAPSTKPIDSRSLQAKAAALREQRRLASLGNSLGIRPQEERVLAPLSAPVSKPKFRLTVAEARRGMILSRILEEPRYKKRWSPLSR